MRPLPSALALLLALTLAAPVAGATAVADLLPPPGAGWKLKEAPRTYSPATLYEYIDGNADLFLSYGFKQAVVGDYSPDAGEGWVSVDVYDMGAPLHAFGIYRAERPEGVEAVALGVQGYSSAGLMAFWKGPYYVKVSLIEGDDVPAARRLAEAAAGAICGEAAMPPELGRLPAEQRVGESERYIKQGALGHKFLVEVVSADYKINSSPATLYIADLGAVEESQEGMRKLREFEADAAGAVAGLPGVGEDGFAAKDPYYGEMVIVRSGRSVFIAASETASREALSDLVRSVLPPPR